MALTSLDETDLLLPLFTGAREKARFSTFLARLRRRAGVDHAALLIRFGSQLREYFAGVDLTARARQQGLAEPGGFDPAHHDGLRPGRVYSVSELVDHDPIARAARARRMAKLGMVDERVVRIAGSDLYDAWLVVVRAGTCSAADSALLSSLAPYVAIALDQMLDAERERLRGRVAGAGLLRARKGWMAFDREARLIAIDPAAARCWQERTGSEPRAGERLAATDLGAQRELAKAAADMAEDPALPARPVVLRDAPRIEALLMPMEPDPGEAMAAPAMLALLTLAPLPRREGAQRLAQVFDLPGREAELAMALADGQSIAEAAQAMGLTLETARNYSKRLYAKLGVRGQAELVRAVYESSAALA